jgi:hypothetical protein
MANRLTVSLRGAMLCQAALAQAFLEADDTP